MVSKNLSNFTIRLGNAAQVEEQLRAAYGTWNRGRTWEGYMEDQLQCVRDAEDDWTKDGAFQTWVLVERDNCDGPIYAGCATFRRKSFYREAGSTIVKDGFSYVLTMVVTPEEYRRKGYQTHLLRLLHYQIGAPADLPSFPVAEWGLCPPPLSPKDQAAVPRAIASTLWSDVGSNFYERVTIGTELPGWVVQDEECQQITWKLFPSCPQSLSAEKKWDWIYTRDLPSVGEQLSISARKQMSRIDTGTAVWSPDPASAGILQYVPSRTLRPLSKDWRSAYDSEPCGIRLPATTPGNEGAIVLFVPSPLIIGRAVHITYIHNLDSEQLSTLLQALDEVGARHGLSEGWVWGISPDEPLGKAWSALDGRVLGYGKRDESNGHLLGVAWYGNSENRGRMVDTQMWSWC